MSRRSVEAYFAAERCSAELELREHDSACGVVLPCGQKPHAGPHRWRWTDGPLEAEVTWFGSIMGRTVAPARTAMAETTGP